MVGLVVSARLGEALAQIAPGVGGVPMVLALQSPKRLDRLAQQLFSIVPLPFVAKQRTQVTQRLGYRWMLVAVHFAIDGPGLTAHRLGVVKAAIWANDTKVGVRYGVTLQRLYKDGQEWKTTDSFGGDDTARRAGRYPRGAGLAGQPEEPADPAGLPL